MCGRVTAISWRKLASCACRRCIVGCMHVPAMACSSVLRSHSSVIPWFHQVSTQSAHAHWRTLPAHVRLPNSHTESSAASRSLHQRVRSCQALAWRRAGRTCPPIFALPSRPGRCRWCGSGRREWCRCSCGLACGCGGCWTRPVLVHVVHLSGVPPAPGTGKPPRASGWCLWSPPAATIDCLGHGVSARHRHAKHVCLGPPPRPRARVHASLRAAHTTTVGGSVVVRACVSYGLSANCYPRPGGAHGTAAPFAGQRDCSWTLSFLHKWWTCWPTFVFVVAPCVEAWVGWVGVLLWHIPSLRSSRLALAAGYPGSSTRVVSGNDSVCDGICASGASGRVL